MKVAGIIAEYNPFHNGHKYHIEETKKITGADKVIVVMSGDFVQRGTPALMEKFARTEMALHSGADLVIELPTVYACASAEFFAKGAVTMLHKLSVVDSLCFGSECGDISVLQKTAKELSLETDNFSNALKKYTKEGYSYPQARVLALKETSAIPNVEEILNNPNNILGVEYGKALLSLHSAITPYTIKRSGNDYNDASLKETYSSALSIRNALLEQKELTELKAQLPSESYSVFEKHFKKDCPVFADDVSSILQYKLITGASKGFTDYLDVNKELSDRICNNLYRFTSFTDFCELLKTKEVTYSRISRCLIHILLNITKEDFNLYQKEGNIFYARILGFREDATDLLSQIKKSASIPLISKLADASKQLSPIGLQMLNQDILASHIYGSVVSSKFHKEPQNEYTKQIKKTHG